MRHATCISILGLLLLWGAGCAPVFKSFMEAKQGGEPGKGTTYYVGGAGPIGHVGSWDVPLGLVEGGCEGRVEVYPWQSFTHAGDQINLSRNREKAAELAGRIKRCRRLYPDAPINILALSAGTGIAAFALEFLPEDIAVDHVIFLGCSLSSRYDLTRALKRIRGRLYLLHSPHDMILRSVVRYTGTVDRNSAAEGVAGLEGFRFPMRSRLEAEEQYKKLYNVPYRREFSEVGYGGGHTGATGRAFVRRYIAPALLGDGHRLLGIERDDEAAARPPASRPAEPPRP